MNRLNVTTPTSSKNRAISCGFSAVSENGVVTSVVSGALASLVAFYWCSAEYFFGYYFSQSLGAR
jgi:hypothetical protein